MSQGSSEVLSVYLSISLELFCPPTPHRFLSLSVSTQTRTPTPLTMAVPCAPTLPLEGPGAGPRGITDPGAAATLATGASVTPTSPDTPDDAIVVRWGTR